MGTAGCVLRQKPQQVGQLLGPRTVHQLDGVGRSRPGNDGAGWEAYSSMFKGYFNDPTPGPATTFLHENVQVTVLDKVATASYRQTRQRANGNLKSREVRVLEKQGDAWKLVSVYSRNME